MIQGLLARVGTTLLGAAVVGGIGLAVGFGMGVAYENTVPWGLGPKLERLRESIPVQVSAAVDQGRREQAQLDATAFAEWDASLKQCESLRRSESENAATMLADASRTRTTSRDAAYAAGRASGLSTCRARTTNESSTGDDGGGDDAGVVRDDDVDLRDILGPAAYAPRDR